MATVAQLNVAIGTRLDGLRSGLKQAERELRISGQRLSNLGNDLSIAISAPLAAFGASAVKAAGDMQALQLALETTMANGGRTIAEARMELEALRQASLAPGLDFEQAVKGSIRLQNVGFKAEEARAILVQLANAVAMTGGSAQELDSVTRQFGQMIAKGRVMQEDLSIIQENMPAISAAMEKAFGTKSAEQLRDMGVSAEDFIKGVTSQLAELPRVEGGISNAITNAGSAIQQFLASVGKEIDKAFNLGKVADDFAAFLADAAKWFSELDDSTKKAVVQVGLFVVALGPAVKLLGVVQLAAAQFVGSLKGIVGGLKSMAGGLISAVSWFGQLNVAMKLSVIGATIAAVTALYFAFDRLSNSVNLSTEINRKAAESIADEKSRVDLLLPVLKSETATRQEKAAAVDELKRINPQYFGQLDSEKIKITDVTKAYDAYIANLMRSARAAAAREKLIEVEKQLLDIEQRRGQFTEGEKMALGMIGITAKSTEAFERQKAVLDAQAAPLEKIKKELAGIVAQNESFATSTKTISGDARAFGTTTSSALSMTKEKADEATQGMTDLQLSMKDAYRRALQFSKAFSASQPGESNAGLPTVDNGLGSALDLGKSLTPSITGVNSTLLETITLTDLVSKKWATLAEQVQSMAGGPFVQMQALLDGIGSALGPIGEAALGAFSGMANAAMEGAVSMRELGAAAIEGFAKVAKMLIMEIALRAALNSVAKGGIFGALASIGIAAALIGGLTALTKAIKVPAYAEGTNYAKGGLSLVGERGPELVNLPRGSQVIPNHVMRGMGGSNQLQGQFVLSRGDLILAVRTAAAQHLRETGKNPFEVR